MSGANPLTSAHRIGFLGDVHGDLGHAIASADTFWRRGIDVIVQVGDFGVAWNGEDYEKALSKLSRRLGKRNQTIYYVDGNHEDFDILYGRFPVDADGLRLLRPNVIHIPRGWRTELATSRDAVPGPVFAALGGANSIDREHRIEHRDWWPQESVGEADLAALGSEPVDILVGHDAPLEIPELDRELADGHGGWRPSAHAYADEGRRMFDRGFRAVRPRLYVGGHYHRFLDVVAHFADGKDTFRSRVVLLDQNRPKTISLAVLDVRTFYMEFFSRSDATVMRLDDLDAGRWLVRTKDQSVYEFDLDARTVERWTRPGAPAPGPNRIHALQDVTRVSVGAPGLWRIAALGTTDPYFKHDAGVVESIERVAEL